MNSLNIQKLALAFGLLAFGFLAIGSVVAGSRFITGFIRGTIGALVFGGLFWGLAGMVLQKNEDDIQQDVDGMDDNDSDKGSQLNQTA